MNAKRTAAVVLVLVAGSLAGTAHAGLVLQSREGETLISRERIAMPADEVKTVLNGRERTYLVINPGAKLYAQGPLTEYCEMFEKLRQALAGLAQGEAAAPEEPARYEVQPLGRGEPVSGFAVSGYRILRNGEAETDLWVATGRAIEQETLDLGKIAADFMSCVTGREEAILAYREVYRKGVPVRQVSYADGRPSDDGAPVTAIEVREVPDSSFEPPPGYRQVPLARVMGGGEGEAEPAYTGPPPEVDDLIAPPAPLNSSGRQILEMKGMTEADRLREVPLRDEVGLPAMPGAYFTMSSTGTSGMGKPIREAYLVTTEPFQGVDAWYRRRLPEDWQREQQPDGSVLYRPKGAGPMVPPYVSIQKTGGQGMDLMLLDLPGARTRIVLGYWEGGTPPEGLAGDAASAGPGPAEDAYREPPADRAPAAGEDENVIVKDAKEVTGDVVDDTRNEAKRSVRESVKEEVKGFFKGLFKR
ncbi:DUF4412 domain-containing protein [Deferrisoma camini]|uniref:DUF4412 domain-containing protein n=1 Tax=Deferrisoma camini TaxID=1035120 RepID=UPI00046D1A40|nr:DUF4412 domain-containing protein [Deferrisoma camini]